MACLVKGFCCGCSLRQGAIVAGISTLLDSLAFIGTAIYHILTYEAPRNRDYYFFNGVAFISVGAALLLTSILLLIGIGKKKPGLLIPWLIFLPFAFLLALAALIYDVYYQNYFSLVALPFILLLIYLWVVVRSYHKELKKPRGFTPILMR